MIRDTDFYKQVSYLKKNNKIYYKLLFLLLFIIYLQNKGDLNLSEKDELFTPYKLKKKKKKELPRLNFGYNSTVNENFELNKL